MDVLILTSKLLGIYLVVSGLFIIFKSKTIPGLLKDFFKHPAVTYLTGIILIFLASMYLIQFNLWEGGWKMIVTIFAWLVLLKGLAYVFIPGTLSNIAIRKSKGWSIKIWGIIAIVIGIYLFFLG